MKHTPGKWDVITKLSGSENHRGYTVLDEHGYLVADISPRDEDGKEGGANASVIAAAPELLEALRNLKRFTFIERWATKGLDDEAAAMHDRVNALLDKVDGTDQPTLATKD